ncbi:SOS response-associated peptidase family protein [Pseudomonas fragariae (ex Marin et al. 2024)]|uniref:Abasic site processing protein n=2 Tax=Pseudomonas fragariae (ex Marin et al. 2024) TaxID=3080056 RepID=A0ABT3LQG0_9PSED|nr:MULTISPECIES: SOS response-associated peptidase family protein [unclassified Pseudomonas]MCW6058226.1 SOS response-associated peptidase family protein [Pseudomonas fragi]MDV0428321.1 SOS response-associated peptidase family protein [Pseudomonas sp. 17]MDX9573965.1 SOS response-associated peptidase family protein [Pseudomonas sp. 21(2023)]MDX9586787.1 SOS response-associated peptidase family protein [Pseudomonas sp. 19(2023)]MDY6478657.1 SOS response-associated peptidase family protein [Pseu
MCGRYSIYESMDHYLKELAPKQLVINGYDLWPIKRYNVAPSTRVEIIRPTEQALSIDKVHWGWAPFWAKGKRPEPINARVETVMTGKFFKELWPEARALAPANGWFEWVKDPGDPKKKQPYYIRLKSQKPMFFATLARVHAGLEQNENDGFVIITAASDRGMVDIHDRRPVVLSPVLAREWVDPHTDAARAAEIAHEGCTPTDEFEWYAVDRAVGNVRNQGEKLILPLGVTDSFRH